MHTYPESHLPRRRFLQAAGATTLGLAVAGRAAASFVAAEKWTMQLSCSSINFSRLPIEQACQRIAALGFAAIDIWSAHAGCPHLDDVLTRLGPERLKELLAKSKLKLCGFSVYVGGFRKYAELLGGVGGGVAIRGSAGACDPKELTARMKQFLEGLKPDAELAEKHNAYLAIENHGGALLNLPDSFKAFVDANQNPRVGIALAPYHVQAAKASVEEVVAIVGKQLLFFYAWQNAPGEKQLPGLGPADCQPWLAALAKAGYGGYVNPFMHHEPEADEMSKALAASCEYLKKCYGQLGL